MQNKTGAKKIITLLLVFAMVFPALFVSAAEPSEYFFKEDFSGTYSWNNTGTGASTVTVKDRPDKPGDKALYIQDNEDATAGATKNISAKADVVVAETDIMIEGSSAGSILFYLNNGTKYVACILFEKETIKIYTTKSEILKSGLKADTWYNVKVVASFASKTVDVYLNNEKIGAGFPFRTADASAIDKISLMGTSKPSPSTGWYDNVKVYDGKYFEGAAGGMTPPPATQTTASQPTSAPSTGGSVTPIGGETTVDGVKYYHYEDFTRYAVDALPFTVNIGKDCYAGVKDKGDSHGKAFFLNDADDTINFGGNLPLKVPDKTPVFDIDLFFEGSSSSSGSSLIYLNDDAGKYGLCMSFTKGSLKIFHTDENGKTASTIISGEIKVDGWFNLKAALNYDTKTADIYIDNNLAGEALPFRGEAVNLGRAFISGALSPSPSKMWHDNIKVYSVNDLKVNPKPIEAPKDPVTTITSMATHGAAVEKLSTAVSLFIDRSTAYVYGKQKRIDENNPSVKPVVINGRTLVPVRFISESFGADVGWNEAAGEVTVELSGKTIKLWINNTEMDVSGTKVTLDVPAQTISDRTMIPLRALVEALGKNVFWDEAGLIIISDNSGFISRDTEPALLDRIIDVVSRGREKYSYDEYARVFFSTRFWRDMGQSNLPNSLGSLDAKKRFSATDDKWSYISNKDQVAAITGLGGKYQTGVNINLAELNVPANQRYENGRMARINGDKMKSPNMTWETAYGCANSPEYLQIAKDYLKLYQELDVSAIQMDDPGSNNKGYQFGGCFCKYCMEGFTKYLKDNCTEQQIKDFGIDDIDSFNYLNWLITKHGVKPESAVKQPGTVVSTTDDYTRVRGSLAVDKEFHTFQILSSRNFILKIRDEITKTFKNDIEFSYNNYEFLLQFQDKYHEGKYMHDVFDYGIAEHTDDSYSLQNAVTGGTFSSSLKKPQIVSPVSRSLTKGRQGLATCYALGQYFLVPYDIYVPLQDRTFASVDEYGDMYHFIRQYPELFNGYEVPAEVGILTNWDVLDKKALVDISMNLFRNGIPFKDIVASSSMPTFRIDPKDLEGIKYLVEMNPVDGFTSDDKAVIQNSGIKIIKPEDISTIVNEVKYVSAEGGENINALVRTMPGDYSSPKVIHVLNHTGFTKNNAVLTIEKSKFFGEQNYKAALYRPGKNVEILPVNGNQIVIPEMNEWAILKVYPESFDNSYILEGGWQFMNLGSPTAYGDRYYNGGTLLMSSRGAGTNSATVGDKGTQDQGAFAYKVVNGKSLDGFDLSAKITALTQATGETGIMIRDDASSNSPFIFLKYKDGKVILQQRAAYDKITTSNEIKTMNLPVYLKTEKKGDVIKVYASNEEGNFGEALWEGSLLDAKFAGIFTSSGKQYVTAAAEISNIVFEEKSYIDSANITDVEISIDKNVIKRNTSVNVRALAVSEDKKYTVDKSKITAVSSNPAVAEVNGTEVTAKTTGSADIDVTLELGGKTFTKKLTITVSDSNVVYEDNFDWFTPEAILPAWSFNNPAIKPVKEGNGYILRVTSNEKGQTSDATVTFEPVSGKVVFEFDYRGQLGVNDNDSGGRVIYAGNQNVCIIDNGKNFTYFYGADQKVISPMEQDKWYHFKIIADTSTYTTDVYIDDKQVVEKGAFRKNCEEFSQAQFGGFRVNPDVFHDFDNIKIYSID